MTGEKQENIEYEILNEDVLIDDLEEKLHKLYQSPFSDITYLNLQNSSITENACCKLVIHENSVLKHIILFKYKGKEKKIAILNQCIKMSTSDVETICEALFHKFSHVQQIVFSYLFMVNKEKKEKIIYKMISDDSILELPESMNEYLKTLDKKTRKYFQYYEHRIEKELPDFEVVYSEKQNIRLEQVEQVVQLNRDRMKNKGIRSGVTGILCEKSYQYARLNGFLCLCCDKGNIIGGTICSVVGEHAFVHTVAHDDHYQKYSIGQIALIKTIQYAIDNKIKQIHLLWGDFDYKSRLLCKKCDLFTVVKYRKKAAWQYHKMICAVVSFAKGCKLWVKKKLIKCRPITNIYRSIRKLILFGWHDKRIILYH